MNTERKFLVYNSDNMHEYDIIMVSDDKTITYSLYYSSTGEWSDHIKGKFIMTLLDDGGVIKITESLQELDYSKILQLRILLNFESQICESSNLIENFNVIEEKILFTV